MLKITPFEFIVRLLPEAFIFMFAAYTFSKTKIDKKKYLISSIILGTCVFLIRMLPINYGVHTILNIITLPIISHVINKIEIIEAIKASIMTSILLFIVEGLNMVALSTVFGENVSQIMANATTKTICGLPSIILLSIIVCCNYYYLRKKDKFKYV